MMWSAIARPLLILAAGAATSLTVAAGPAGATDANPLDCAGVGHAKAVADRESAARGTDVVPMCMNHKVYAGIPLAVAPHEAITVPGTVSLCLAERETVAAASRHQWQREKEVVPMCIQNRAFGVYEP